VHDTETEAGPIVGEALAARRSGCEARVNLDEKVSPDA
jgi:hypothetical protein